MPAFCVMPKWSPLGFSIRKSAVNGTFPDGPVAWVRIFQVSADAPTPSTSSVVMSRVSLLLPLVMALSIVFMA